MAGLLFLAAVGASADSDLSSLPIDLGQASIDASRRAILADIQDWKDDRELIRSRLILACALAGAQKGVWIGVTPPLGASLATVELIGDLAHYLGQGRRSGPSSPLYTPLSELARAVAFTDEERRLLASLMGREAVELSDRIRLAIDTQAFLIKVTERLYQERIDFHFRRTEGFLGFFRAEQEYCQAFRVWTERDTVLISAGERVLSLYAFLEQELGD